MQDIQNSAVPGEIVAECLVETLEDVAAGLRSLADGPGAVTAEEARYFSEVISQAARVAAVANIQREELEKMVTDSQEFVWAMTEPGGVS